MSDLVTERYALFDIVMAMDGEGGIGKDGKLPWSIPKDMDRFRCITSGMGPQGETPVVIMGRKTWESLPKKPLPGRVNIVLTSQHPASFYAADTTHSPYVIAVRSLGSALLMFQHSPTFVIGGASVFEEALSHPGLRRIELTRINGDYGCDTFVRSKLPGTERICSGSTDGQYAFETIYVNHHQSKGA